MFSFKGRASRLEYIKMTIWVLFVSLLLLIFLFREFYVLIMMITNAILVPASSFSVMHFFGFIFAIFVGVALLFIVPLILKLPTMVRRFHDLNKSGWWALLSFVPFAGFWIDSICTFTEGTKGSNRFGPETLRTPK